MIIDSTKYLSFFPRHFSFNQNLVKYIRVVSTFCLVCMYSKTLKHPPHTLEEAILLVWMALCFVLICDIVIFVIFSFVITSLRKRELVALCGNMFCIVRVLGVPLGSLSIYLCTRLHCFNGVTP